MDLRIIQRCLPGDDVAVIMRAHAAYRGGLAAIKMERGRAPADSCGSHSKELIGTWTEINIGCYAACVMTALEELSLPAVPSTFSAVSSPIEWRTRHNMVYCNCSLFLVAEFLINSRSKAVAADAIVILQFRGRIASDK